MKPVIQIKNSTGLAQLWSLHEARTLSFRNVGKKIQTYVEEGRMERVGILKHKFIFSRSEVNKNYTVTAPEAKRLNFLESLFGIDPHKNWQRKPKTCQPASKPNLPVSLPHLITLPAQPDRHNVAWWGRAETGCEAGSGAGLHEGADQCAGGGAETGRGAGGGAGLQEGGDHCAGGGPGTGGEAGAGEGAGGGVGIGGTGLGHICDHYLFPLTPGFN